MNNYLSNLPGWKTNKKIVVIESDDWGSERFPNIETIKKFAYNGYEVRKCGFSRFDCLETNNDIIALLEIIENISLRYSKKIKISLLCNTSNPNLSLINPNDIHSYKSISVFDMVSFDSNRNDIIKLQVEGYNKGYLDIQYHGRQHININRWMSSLVNKNTDAIFAFRNGVWGISKSYSKNEISDYRASYAINDINGIQTYTQDFKIGLEEFRNAFGFIPRYFVPPNGHFPIEMERIIHHLGIKFMNFSKVEYEPIKGFRKSFRINWMGKVQDSKLITITRNVGFEPISPISGNVEKILEKVNLSFQFKNPVVISTHRANYVSGISEINRKNGLLKLSKLLISIINKWPDVLFLSSTDLGEVISGKRKLSEFQ